MAETAIATRPAETALAPSFGAQMQLQTLERALEFAKIIHASGLAPKGLNAEGIVIAMQMGYEVGLSPMQAVQNIASINGRPAIWGDAQLALVRASGLLESYAQCAIGEPGTDGRGYRVTVKRKGSPEANEEFTVADAKRAGLWGKPGPWSLYPQRMLLFRARGFILRDQFGDVLKGLKSAEEVMDEPTEKDITAEVVTNTAPESRLRAPRKAKEPAPASVTVEAAAPAPEPAKAPQNEVPYTPIAGLAAVEAVGVPRDVLVRWLKGTDRMPAGLDHLSQQLLAAMVNTPHTIAAAVSAWTAEQDAAEAQLPDSQASNE